jgi:hypothetical protein
MKKITLLLFLIGNFVLAQNTAVPDPNFEQVLIDLGYDTVLDGQVLTSNINNVVELDVYEKNINDITGIEGFTALQSLTAGSNNYTNINLTQNTELKVLNLLPSQPLDELDVSANINLEELYIACPSLNYVDVTNNPKLKTFYSREFYSNLTFIDITQNPLLQELRVRNNQLTELDVSNNPFLMYLECDGNNITNLNITNNLELGVLFCGFNPLTEIDTSQNSMLWWADFTQIQLTDIDLSQNQDMSMLRCNDNANLTSLNIQNGTNFGLALEAIRNPNLKCIFVDDKNNIPSNWTVDPNVNYVESQAECDALGIDELNTTLFNLYPNPANKSFYIDSKISIEKVSIYDVFGKLIKTFPLQNEYDVSELSNGMYIINIETDKGTNTKKFIKQ